MQIPLNVLLFSFSTNSLFEVKNASLGDSFEGIKLFDPDAIPDGHRRCLYMTTVEELKSYTTYPIVQQGQCPHVFLCLCPDKSITSNTFSDKLSVVLLYTKLSFPFVFNQFLTIFDAFENWDRAFQLKLSQGSSLQELLNITKGFLSHPMIVFDRNFSVLGYVREPDAEDPFMDDLVQTGYATPESLARLREDGLISTAEDAANPLINQYNLDSKDSYYSMMYRFTSNRNIVGYVLVMRCSHHPKTNYLYLMNMVCGNLKKYFQQERFANRASSEMYEAILADLLEHPELPQQQLADQIQSLTDLPLEGNFILARISYTGTKDLPYSFVSRNLRASIPSMKPFVCNNILYVLKINTEADNCCEFLTEMEEPFFKQNFRNQSFTCGLSQTFFSLTDLHIAAKQCEAAVHIGARVFSDSRNYYHFADIMVHYMINEMRQSFPFQMISSPYYAILKKYDDENNGDLCPIFTQYLLNGRNVNQTSNKTFMHRNTVLNKIKKATSIMNNTFNDYHDQTAFIFSYFNDEHPQH